MRRTTAGPVCTRLMLLAGGWLTAASAAACGPGPRPAAAPPAAVAPVPAEAPPPARTTSLPRDISVCVVQNGRLEDVTALYDPVTRDTSFGPPGRELPGLAATGKEWYIYGNPIHWRERQRVRYGPERAFRPGELVFLGDYVDVPVFAEPGAGADPERVYVPVRQGCVFQAYYLDDHAGAVRG
jgi:hypothetical protein